MLCELFSGCSGTGTVCCVNCLVAVQVRELCAV